MAPAGQEAPLVPVTPGRVASANALLHRVLESTPKDRLTGTPVSLREAIEAAPGDRQQLEIVRAYWSLVRAMAADRFSRQEARYLTELPVPQSAADQALVGSFQARAEAEEAQTRWDAIRAQHDLAEAMHRDPEAALPIASDLPLVGPYQTHFEVLHARGAAPARLQRIDRALPMIRELIDRRASAVEAAAKAVEQLRLAYEAGTVNAGALLDAHERLRRQRRAFLSAVADYNHQIAEYAFSVTVPAQNARRRVAMLIERPVGADRSVLSAEKRNGRVEKASNDEPLDFTPQFRTPRRPVEP